MELMEIPSLNASLILSDIVETETVSTISDNKTFKKLTWSGLSSKRRQKMNVSKDGPACVT